MEMTADDRIAPEQVLRRPDRPLIHLGLKWNPVQTLIACAGLGACAVWLVAWGLWGAATDALMTGGSALAALPWLVVPEIALWGTARYGVRLYRDNEEPVRRQRWGSRWRALRTPVRVDRRRVSIPRTARTAAVPVRVWRDTSDPRQVYPPVEVSADGLARVLEKGDGRYRAYLDVTPTILRGKSIAQREAARGRLAEILRDVRPGYRVELWVDNTPTDARGVARGLDRTEAAPGTLHDAIRRGRRRWLDAEMKHTYAASGRYLLIMEGDDPAALSNRCEDIARVLEAAGPTARPLGQAAVTALLAPPARLTPRDGYVRVDEAMRTTIYARDWPAQVSFDDLLGLPLLPVASTLAITIRPRDPQKALAWLEGQADRMRSSDLNKRRALARASARDGLVMITQEHGDVALQADAKEIERIYAEVRDGRTSIVDVGLAITVEAPDVAALALAVDVAAGALGGLGFTVGRGAPAQVPLARATLPLCLGPYRPLPATRRTASALFPFVKENPGPATGILLGRTERGGQLAFFDWGLAATDVVAILADQGMGKSYILGLLLDATLRRGEWVTVLDPVASFRDLMRGHNGVEVELLAPGVSINLLEIAGASREDPILIMLDNFQLIFGYDLAASGDDAILEEGLRGVYGEAARRAARGWDGTPRLRYLATWLRRQERHLRAIGDAGEAQACRKLYRRLRPYYGRGSFATLMDYKTTVKLDAPGLLLNTARFATREGPAAALSAAGATTTADLRTALAEEAGTAATTALDEGYLTIKQSGPWFQGRGRRTRHERTRVVICTHMIEDLANDPETRKVMTAIKIYFVGCTQSDRSALVDRLKFPPHLADRAPDLRRTEDRAEFVYLVRPPDAAPEYAVVHVKLVPELAYTLGSYGVQKDQRARDIARLGSVAAAAKAAVAAATKAATVAPAGTRTASASKKGEPAA